MPEHESRNLVRQERGYRWAALLVCLGLIVAVVLGFLGARGPGVFTPESAFMVGGVALLIVAAGLVYMFLTYRAGFARLRERVLGLSGVAQRLQQEEEASHRAHGTRLERLETKTADRRELEILTARVGVIDDRGAALESRVAHLPDPAAASFTRTEGEALLQDLRSLRADLATLARAHNEECTRLEERTKALEGNSSYEALRQRIDLVEEGLAERPAQAQLEPRFAEHRRSEEKLWTELQRLLVDLRQVEELRRQEQHFRQEVESFQNRLAEDHARVEEQVARLTAFQTELQATREELVRVRADARRSVDDARRLHQDLELRFAAHEAHPLPRAREPVPEPGIPLKAIEGIGEVFQDRLHADGILSLDDLREAYPDEVAAAVGTTPERVRQWQDMAELMRLPTVGPQFAELLVLSGVRSIEQLAGFDADALLAKVTARVARRRVRITRDPFDRDTAQGWIRDARECMVQTMPRPPDAQPPAQESAPTQRPA